MNSTITILKEIQTINHRVIVNKEIYNRTNKQSENEYLLILKPEIFINKDFDQLKSILDLIESKLLQYDLTINNVRIQNASYLKKYNVIAKHYGVINAVSNNVSKNITEEAKLNFKSIYGIDYKEVQIWGSLEILNNDKMSASTLAELWKDCEIKRLGGGIYCGKVEYQDESIYIINGFHPPQLEHFTTDNRMIITMNLNGNTNWKIARKELIGNTYPEKANFASIRGEVYSKYGNFGFNNVSYVINSVHLSAGPLEGLIELKRFNSSYENNSETDISNFIFGKLLLEHFTPEQCNYIISNPTVNYNNKAISLFDLTEELDSNKAIDILKQVII